jgi:hypothetical protein
LPVLLRFAVVISSSANLWFIQMSQKIPGLGLMTILVPLLGGAATFAYRHFKIKPNQ